jgi:tetratricopeptide (TPR) repeat protein
MKSISKLKDEARKYEQREEWEKAIQAYLQVLRVADEGEAEVELPLYNRVGDLCVRLGKPQEAVRHYEQAADRYAEAGLYNNAIALCNKALRYNPDRLELIRKLGQFSASQGFITDARRYFLDYAERQFKGGKITEALTALEDFANVSDDPEIREMLGRQLQAHGRINDAVDELRRAHAMRLREGQTDLAEGLRAEILAIDPHAKIDGGAAAPADTRSRGPADLPGLVEIEPPAPEPSRPVEPKPAETESLEDPDTGTIEGLETAGEPVTDEEGLAPIEITGFEGASDQDLVDLDARGADGGIEGLETTTFDFGEVEGSAPALEDLGLEREEMSFGGADARDAETFELPTLDEPDTGFDLPTLDDPETDLPTLDDPDPVSERPAVADDTGSFDLPLLGDDEPAAPVTDASVQPPDVAADAPADSPDTVGSESDDLGGDLPLDLSSFGLTGSSPFDLPTLEEDAGDSAEWKDEPSFDMPTIDGESLGLPTWEAEPDTMFDLPAFDTEPDAEEPDADEPTIDETVLDEPVIDEPIVDEPAVDLPGVDSPETPVPADPVSERSSPAASPTEADVGEPPAAARPAPRPAAPRQRAAPVSIDVPAIELPTWETDPSLRPVEERVGEPAGDVSDIDVTGRPADVTDEELSSETADTIDAVDDEPAYETASEPSEPSWVEATPDLEDDLGRDLPTFTYEEEDEGEEPPVIDEAEEPDSAAPVEHDDPLGLAAHLAGQARDRDRGTARTEQRARGEPLDSAWLDEVADDAPAADAPESATAPPASDAPAAELPVAGEPAVDPGADPAGIDDVTEDDPWADAPASKDTANVARGRTDDSTIAPAKDEYIDLGAFLTGDDEKETTRFRVQETAPTGDEDRDFAELLSQFKSKVQEHLPPEDAAAHYDLGLAFKEMGLTDEAIGEFQIALRAGHMRLRVYEELGQCFLEKEQYNVAEKVLRRALDLKFDDELELLGVYYHLGRAYEALGRRDEARDAYERVLGMDINFGDVTDRLARL